MKPQYEQRLRGILAFAIERHAELAHRMKAEQIAVNDGHPTPPHAPKGRSTLKLLDDERKDVALRVVIAATALKAPEESRKIGLGLRDAFAWSSPVIAQVRGKRVLDIIPEADSLMAFEIEAELEPQGAHFRSHRVRSFIEPKK